MRTKRAQTSQWIPMGSCSRPVLQQNGRADVRRPYLLNGGHTLCVESVSRHNQVLDSRDTALLPRLRALPRVRSLARQ
jgi:hypothetical protein